MAFTAGSRSADGHGHKQPPDGGQDQCGGVAAAEALGERDRRAALETESAAISGKAAKAVTDKALTMAPRERRSNGRPASTVGLR
jgi:hypothetical protein